MKTSKLFMIIAALGALMISCSDKKDDTKPGGGGSGSIEPAKVTVEAFNKAFPNASNVVWSKKNGYDLATFVAASTRATAPVQTSKAWFVANTSDMTYTSLDMSFAELKAEAPAVVTAWEASAYKTQGYLIDDIAKRQYTDTDIPTYRLDVELNDAEIELIYKQDGTLVSEKPKVDGEDDDEPAPLELLDFVKTNLPEAVVVDSESDDENGVVLYEIEILYPRANGKVEYIMIFDKDLKLLYIMEEIDEEDAAKVLPAAVSAKFAELAAGGEIDEVGVLYQTIEAFKTQESNLYIMFVEIEDENGDDKEMVYIVNAEGEVVI